MPLERLVFDAHDLMARHPPVLRHPNKRIVFEIACPPGSNMAGTLTYTRWRAMPLPAAVDLAASAARVGARHGLYDYTPSLEPLGSVQWHVNFADPNLFVAYGSRLFAQDEMQVAEHPALGSLREALLASGHQALTVERGRPTPVLIMGVERLCLIETNLTPPPAAPRGSTATPSRAPRRTRSGVPFSPSRRPPSPT